MAGDFLTDMFAQPNAAAKAKPEKGVPLRSRTIDGVMYLRVEDVAELLRVNEVLPKMEAALRKRL